MDPQTFLTLESSGELAMEGNFLHFYGEVLGYLNEMVLGRSKETADVEASEPVGEQGGQSS